MLKRGRRQLQWDLLGGEDRLEEALGQKKSPTNASWLFLFTANTQLHLIFLGPIFWTPGHFLLFPSWLGRSGLQREDYFKTALAITFGFFTFHHSLSFCTPHPHPIYTLHNQCHPPFCKRCIIWLCGLMTPFLPSRQWMDNLSLEFL